MFPTAADVAARAGVGLRTVFRHFEDMESIFEEMTRELKAITMPEVTAPFQARGWRAQLTELIDRNAALYEKVFPMQTALFLRKYQSDVLHDQYEREVKLLCASLKAILPRELAQDRARFAALEALYSFSTWRRLREDQGLTVARAADTLKLMLTSLLGGVSIDDEAERTTQ